MIKKIVLIATALLFFLPSTSLAVESIGQFSVLIEVNSDASIVVKEHITYDLGESPRHGIFRDIPYKYTRNGINYNLRISDISVTDERNQAYKFTTSTKGSDFEIKIGDPDVTIVGVHEYIISYKVDRAVNYFDDHDELYWNAVGTSWPVPIQNVSADVDLPSGTVNSIACFTGVYESNKPCANSNFENASAFFREPTLDPYQGLTIVIGWPKGIVTKPSKAEVLLQTIRDNLIFLLPIIGLALLYWIWHKHGKDPKASIPIAAQYEPPDKLTPIEVGFLLDEKNQSREITGEIIYLATLGYLKIERIPGTGWFGKDDYKLTRLKKEDDLPNHFDRNLMRTLFVLGPDEVLLSSLRKKAKVKSDNFDKASVAKKMVADGYYAKDPYKVRGTFMGLAGACFALSVFFLPGSWAFKVSLGLVCLIALAFGYFMPKKTQKGSDAKQMILGLKEYLSVAEKDRLDFHNDPAKDPKIFEKLLPYAIALGVSEQWSKKFEGLFDYHPSWYNDSSNLAFNTVLFNSSLNSFNRGFETMVVANQSNAGSGGSGFGGGGFSGGGGGGGGGGSW